MANRSYLNFEDELKDPDGELVPDDSISDRVQIPDFAAQALESSAPAQSASNPMIDAIMKRRAMPNSSPLASSDESDPLMQRYESDQNDLNKYREAKRGSDFIANMGQAFSNFSLGGNAPKQSSNLYDQMGKQNSEMLKSKEEDLDRRQKIVNAIEARKMRNEMESGRREDRNLMREQIYATRGQARTDKKEAQARLSEKQLGEVQDFDNSVDSMKSVLNQLGNKSEWTGPVDGRLPDAVIGSEQVAFRSELGRMVDQYRKLITGAGASNQELKKLEGRLPQPTDTYANFVAKGKNFISAVERGRGNFMKNLKAQGKNTSPFEGSSLEKESSGSNKVIVTNGKETYAVDPSDVADAEKDGFRRM